MADLRAAELGRPWRIGALSDPAPPLRPACFGGGGPTRGRSERRSGPGRSAAAGQRRRRRRGAPWVPVRGRGPFQAALAQRALRLRTTRRRRAAPERRGWRALSRRRRSRRVLAAATGPRGSAAVAAPPPSPACGAALLLGGAPGGRRCPLPSHRRLPLLPPSPSCVALSPASPAGEAGRPWRGKAERPRRTCFPPLLLLPCGGGAWRGGGERAEHGRGARRPTRGATSIDSVQMAGSRPGCGERPGQESGAGATRNSWERASGCGGEGRGGWSRGPREAVADASFVPWESRMAARTRP
jgi:hypothetical protein